MNGFRFVEYPAYDAPTAISCRALTGLAAPGELLSLVVGITCERAISSVELTASDFRGGLGFSGASDLRVVKTWRQAGVGVYQSASTVVPELLLKDDRVALRDSYGGWCGHWRHLARRSQYYRPPRVALSGPAMTSLSDGETKQIWVSITIAPDCEPGVYEASIAATTPDSHDELPIRLEVLPLSLAEPTHDVFLWYKGTLDCRIAQHYVTPTLFEAQLRDIYAHGFRSISLNESRPDNLRRAIAIAKAVGFRRTIVLNAPFDIMLSAAEFAPLTPVYYLSDELDARGATAVAHHVKNWTIVKRTNARTMVSLINAATARRFDDGGDIGHAPDVLSYYLPTNLSHFGRAAADRGTVYYYWLTHMEKPLVHRVLAGAYLWRSGAAGIAPYCYQHLPVAPNSPFDDFDEWEPGFQLGAERRPFKDHMTTYPAHGGVIPTLQWKGLSDGITDLRYLTTLDALVKRAATAASDDTRRRAFAARDRVGAFLDRVSLTDIDIVSDTTRVPYNGIAPSAYRAFREGMARDAVELSGMLASRSTERATPA